MIFSLDTATGISQKNLNAFFASQLFFVTALHTELTDIVATAVVVVGFDVGRSDFADIAEDMGSVGTGILTDAVLDDVETGEEEEFLLKAGELLGGQLAHENLLRVGTVARIAVPVLDFYHSPVEPIAGDAQTFTQVERINACDFRHDNHDVVGGLVIHKQLSVAVANDTTGRELDTLQEGITIGIALEVVAHQLKREQANEIDDDDEYRSTPQYIPTVVVLAIIFHGARSPK